MGKKKEVVLNEPYRIAFFDIETAPNIGMTWGKYEQNVITFIKEWYILCFTVKWADTGEIISYKLPDFPLYKKDKTNDRELVKKLWEVFDKADLLIAQNGDDFDIKKSNTRFIYHGLQPPTPYKTVDTKKIARKYFGFNSNSLNDLAKFFGLTPKISVDFSVWEGCLAGDKESWDTMVEYNIHDVELLQEIYEKLRSWHVLHPNISVKAPHNTCCPACGSDKVQMRGWNYTLSLRQRRFQCKNCGKWSRLGSYEKLPREMLR